MGLAMRAGLARTRHSLRFDVHKSINSMGYKLGF